MSLRRELRAAGGFAFGLVGLFLAYAHRGDLLVAPFAVLGVALLLGAALAIRERPRVASRAWRWSRRALTIVAALAALIFVVTPISAAVWVTQAPRESVRPFDLAHEDVSLHTRDGLRLAAWYIPSRNGAAVVVVHGGGGTRNGSERHARMLARAGYGVLLYDARGNGESEGRHDAMGWTWEPDITAAVDFLSHRPDVQRPYRRAWHLDRRRSRPSGRSRKRRDRGGRLRRRNRAQPGRDPPARRRRGAAGRSLLRAPLRHHPHAHGDAPAAAAPAAGPGDRAPPRPPDRDRGRDRANDEPRLPSRCA